MWVGEAPFPLKKPHYEHTVMFDLRSLAPSRARQTVSLSVLTDFTGHSVSVVILLGTPTLIHMCQLCLHLLSKHIC